MAAYSKYLLIGLPVLAVAGLAALWWQRRERKRVYKEVARVTELYIYPVKSCRGIRVEEAKCFKEGMEFDRRWIILDENDTFVSQRKDPKLALVVPRFEGDKYLCLDAPGMTTLKLDKKTDGTEFKRIKVWSTFAEGLYVGDEASEWISDYLDKPNCKMYQMTKPRLVIESKYGPDCALPDDKVSFGDLGPYLVGNEATLARVNKELPSPITIQRFRPNVLVRGLAAFEEYKWDGKKVKLGDMEFRFLRICERLKDSDGRDPKYGKAPLFGAYVSPLRDDEGLIRIGDSVMVEE